MGQHAEIAMTEINPEEEYKQAHELERARARDRMHGPQKPLPNQPVFENEEEEIQYTLAQHQRESLAQAEREEEQKEKESNAPKKMGWGVFSLAMTLAFLILGLEWIDLGTLGWMVAIPINLISWFILRPYNKSLKRGKWILGSTLITDSFPIIGLLPIDMIGIIYVFVVSRSNFAQHLEKLTQRGNTERNRDE